MSRRLDRTGRPARQARARRLSLEPLEGRELLTGYSVTTAADNGSNASPTAGSLRAAIISANADNSVAVDTISFAIPGSGVQTIALQSSLPALTRTIVIDGSTQPAYATTNTPLVVLDGSAAGAGANGLTITTGASSVIRGLAIVGFTTNSNSFGGEGIYLAGPAGQATIIGNYIGVGADGSTVKANSTGVLSFSANNTIGGTTAETRNVISGNDNAGVLLAGSGATGNLVLGNYLGTDATGTLARGNQYGVLVTAPNNTIGGTLAGAGNVISGNVGPTSQTGAGVLIEGSASGNLIAGNKIGTNPSGTAAVFATNVKYSNVYGIEFGTPGTVTGDVLARETVGGTVAGAGNLISGNFVGITSNPNKQITSSLIAGNTIGLNLGGTAPISNGDGVLLGASLTTIGGTTPLARNVISASSSLTGDVGTGLSLSGDSDLVQNNYVGLLASGVGSSLTGNAAGMILAVTNSTIGGKTLGNGNIVSGNSGDAIALQGTGAVGVFGNLIGIDINGNADPNGGNGISIAVANPTTKTTVPLALNDTIGDTAAAAGNVIAHSGGAGIVVNDANPAGITGLAIRGNTIFANARLGIDTQGTGVPVPSTLYLNGYSVANGLLTLGGIYPGTPGTTASIDLFANANDPSGFGQGPVYLGSTTVTTNASGLAAFAPTFAAPAGATSFSATATGPDGNTSEFSANFPTVAGAPKSNLVVQSATVGAPLVIGDTVTLIEKVYNLGPNAATSTMLYDSLPTSLVVTGVVSSVGTTSIDGNNVVTANLGTLPANSFVTVTVTATVSQAGTFTDSAGAFSTTFDANYADNIVQQSFVVGQGNTGPTADLAILESVTPTSALVGSPLTYTISVGNIGPNAATNALVNDFLPAGASIVGITASQGSAPSVTGAIATVNLGTLAPGAVATITVIVMPSKAGTITNSVTVAGNQYDPSPANNATTLTTPVTTATPSIHFYLAQNASYPVGAIGQGLVFTLTVENFGPDVATNVFLIDNLPTNVTFLQAAPTQGAAPVVSGGVLKENFGTLAPGGIATLYLVVSPKAIGLVNNVAGVYTPDVPSAAPSFAASTVAIVAGPSVTAVNGFGNNSQVVITFNEALNPTTAMNPANFQLVALGKSATGSPNAVPIASVTYNQLSHSVMLLPAQPLDPTQYYRLTVIGSTTTGVADTFGRRLSSTGFGSPGSNYTVTFFAGTLPQI